MMVFKSNIFQCDGCGLMVIAEELEYHQCKKVEDYKIVGPILWVFDGIRWIPRKLLSKTSDETLQSYKNRRSDDNYTEPYKWFCQVVVGLIHSKRL